MAKTVKQEEQDCCTHLAHVAEAEQLYRLTASVGSSLGLRPSAKVDGETFGKLIGKYQEQASLLDRHLEALITPLTHALHSYAVKAQQQALDSDDLQGLQVVCTMLWRLCNTRGHKAVAKFLSNEAQHLEAAVALLQQLHEQEVAGRWVWESLYAVLLWTSLLVLSPFHLSVLDSAAQDRTSRPPLVCKLLDLCRAQLGRPTSVRDVAGLVLGKLLTRTDMTDALYEFVQWAQGCLESAGAAAVFIVPGCIRALAEIFRCGDRPLLQPVARRLWCGLTTFLSSPQAESSVLARKLGTKLLQRMALTMLPAQVVPWRYQRQYRNWQDGTAALNSSNGVNAQQGPEGPANGQPDPEVCDEVEEAVQLLLTGLADKDSVVRWSAAKGISRITARLPKDLGDEVVQAMLDAVNDYSSDMCWHGTCLALAEFAQRGLLLPERLSTALPLVAKALQYDQRRGAHSVGSHVRDAAAYVCWACARAYEPSVMQEGMRVLGPPLMITACYDREVNCRRAASAAFQECVGRLGNVAHGIDIVTVADYFTLSNRSHAALKIAPQVAQYNQYALPMAEHLLRVKLRHWDAAMRQLAARALYALIPFVGPWLVETGLPFLLQHLLDPALEVRDGCVWGIAEVLPALAHGDLLTQGTVATAIADVPCTLDRSHYLHGRGGETMRIAVCQLIKRCSEVALPEAAVQMNAWLTILDSCLAHSSPQVQLLAATALRDFASTFLSPALTSAPPSSEHNLHQGMETATALLQQYCNALKNTNDNLALARGGALALGALPGPLLAVGWRTVLHALCQAAAATRADTATVEHQRIAMGAATAPGDGVTDMDVRVNATHALSFACCNLAGTTPSALGCSLVRPSECADDRSASTSADGTAQDTSQQHMSRSLPGSSCGPTIWDGSVGRGELTLMIVQDIVPTLMAGIADYTTDNRGDVGSWVRDASMTALTTLLLLLRRMQHGLQEQTPQSMQQQAANSSTQQRSSDLVTAAVCALLKQSVERIGKLRQGALQHLARLHSQGLMDGQHWAGRVHRAVERALAADVIDVTPSLAALAALCEVPELRASMLEGLVASIGGVDQQLAQAALSAVEAVCTAEAAPDGTAAPSRTPEDAHGMRLTVLQDVCELWSQHARSPRLATSFISATEQLLAAALGTLDLTDLTQLAAWPAMLTEVLQLCRGEVKGCRDVGRVCAASRLLCQLVPWGGTISRPALHAAVRMLVSKFPKVRMQCAEALYIQLLAPTEAASNALELPEDAFEAAALLVETTDWSGSGAAAAAVLQLCGLLQLPEVVPLQRKATAVDGQHALQAIAGAVPYQSLVDNLAKGY